jgi:TolB-like protein/DNA-binding winged helix-turn-helix (wHTH) protein
VSETPQAVYEFADFRVDATQRLLQLKGDGRVLPLSSRAFDALLLFLEHPGELLDKSTLMASIWPNVVVEENNLNQHISALRRVLGERPEEHRFIVTIPGRGYRFVADVRRVTDPGTEPAVTARVAHTGRSTRLLWALGCGATALVAAGLWWLFFAHQADRAGFEAGKPVTSIEVVAVHTPRLAILPFENLSPDPENAFFTDGLHEEIVSTIAERVPGIEVISRTTMMTYRAREPKPLAVVARELKASHLIEGSVRREANRVRLTLQLIDARTDGHIWSRSYDRTLADALTLQTQVAEEVAAQLSARLTAKSLRTAPPTSDTEAFDLYLKAVLALRTFVWAPPDWNRIEELLGGAIARDPSFALAYAQRARARTLMFILGVETSEAFAERIRADLDVARKLAPMDPIVLAANGYFLMCVNDTAGALAAYDAAEEAGLADAEWLIPKAQLLLRRSRIEDLAATVRRTQLLDPADPQVINLSTYYLLRAQRPVEALQVLEYGRTVFPDQYAYWRAYVLFAFEGRTAELRAHLERYEPVHDIQAIARIPPTLVDYFDLLRFEHRYADLLALIARIPHADLAYYSDLEHGPVGTTPTAEFAGWTRLLLGDRVGAARDGRAILQYVARQTPTSWNRGYLRVLTAAGYTFTGECERARAVGREGLGLVTRSDNAVIWSTFASLVARTQAWCGGENEAVALLEQLASASPSISPAYITRDPLLTVPLGKLPAYAALSARLEGEMRALSLESSSPQIVSDR